MPRQRTISVTKANVSANGFELEAQHRAGLRTAAEQQVKNT